jgi:hypothetical protein
MNANREDNIWVFDVRAEKTVNLHGADARPAVPRPVQHHQQPRVGDDQPRDGRELPASVGHSRAAHGADRLPLPLVGPLFLGEFVLYSMTPHTHVRGTRWFYEVIYPDGRKEPILSVPKYDFEWQHVYQFKEPLTLPAGTKIRASAWYDNSTPKRIS